MRASASASTATPLLARASPDRKRACRSEASRSSWPGLLEFGGGFLLLLKRATGALAMRGWRCKGRAVNVSGVSAGDRFTETGAPEKERTVGGSAGTKAEFMVWARWLSK